MIAIDGWRDVNTRIPDLESDITNYGKHNRLLVFGSTTTREVTIREDIRPGLSMSTEGDRMRRANSWQRQHPRGTRLTFKSMSERYRSHGGSWECIEYTYTY